MMVRVAVAIAPDVRQLLKDDPSQIPELLEEIHDEDIADLLEMLEEGEAAQVLRALPADQAADIFERLEEDRQEALVEHLGNEEAAVIISEMAPDDRADFFEGLPDEVGDGLLETLEKVDPEAAAEVEELGKWPEDSAGGLMTTDFVTASPNLTVAQTIERIRDKAEEAETVYYVYVQDSARRLLGVASLRDILLASANDKIGDVMTENVQSVSPETDQEIVARKMARYDFSALPVIDAERRVLGVITVDDVIDVLTQEQTEDVQRLAGVEPIEERYFHTTFWTFFRKRIVWLSLLFVGEFFTGSALRQYDDVLAAVGTLSYYVPLLISAGGNAGSQSATLVIRSLAMGDIVPSDYPRILLRELGQGLVMGLALAAIGAARVWMWGDGGRFVVTVAATVVAIVMLGCILGSMFPLLLRRLGLDPATSSAPFIASLVDLLGIIAYFSIAKLVLAEVIAQAHAG
jgi:magnesium transporter